MTIVWEDGTIYNRDEDPKVQRVWRAKLGRMVIILTNGRRFYEGCWVADFEPLFTDKILTPKDEKISVQEAKQRAINLARKMLDPTFKALDSGASTAFCDNQGRGQ